MKNSLSKEDIKKWGKDTIIFCVLPTALVFLNSLQTGDLMVALKASEIALIASLINLLTKYSSGTTKETPTEAV